MSKKTQKTVSFSKNITNVFFHILTKCNLSCLHCYINYKQHGTKTLDFETIKKWLLCFKQKHKNLILLGGEPTLHKDLHLIIKYAKEELLFSSVTLDTNGYLFNDILKKTTPDLLDFISFSLDGADREVNDKIRGVGSYETCIAGIKKAKKIGFNVSLIYTVNSLNVDNLEKMPNLLKELKIDKFFIQIIGIRGNSFEGLQITKEEWKTKVLKVVEKLTNLGINTVYPKPFIGKDEKFECAGILADNYFIFPNGRVYRCPICEDYPLHSLVFDKEDVLIKTDKINEEDLFRLNIDEGCVMNKLVQEGNIEYDTNSLSKYRVGCCLLKEEVKSTT